MDAALKKYKSHRKVHEDNEDNDYFILQVVTSQHIHVVQCIFCI